MLDIISLQECVRLLTRFNETDRYHDIQLIRYYITENELVVKIKYKTVDLKCVIDKLSFVDKEVPNASSIQDFIDFYLKPPMPIIPILGEVEEKESKINISVSQV